MSTRRMSARLVALGGIGALATGLALFAPNAAAAGSIRLVSTSGEDTGSCVSSPCATLQYAVDQAEPGDTVSVGLGTYAQSVHIFTSLTLIGAGATGSGKTTISGDTESGAASIEVDAIDTPPTVTISDVDVSGNADNDGIRVTGGNVTVKDSRASDNDRNGIRVLGESAVIVTGTSVTGNGANGVLLASPPRLTTTDAPADAPVLPAATISNSSIDNNNDAGVLVDAGEASIDHSTVSNNAFIGVAVDGGTATIDTTTLDANVGEGVAVDSGSGATMTNSTVSNTAPFVDGGVDTLGTGVRAIAGAHVQVGNSTIFNNYGRGVLSENAFLAVDNSTISGTRPSTEDGIAQGGAVLLLPVEPAAIRQARQADGNADSTSSVSPDAAVTPNLTLTGTIVAANTTVADCNGAVTDGGYNLASDASCSFSTTGSKNSGDAKLGPLADNGGPTLTLKPAKGSDAIDAIPSGSANCSSGATDQRGVARPQGTNCDIGAVEVEQTPVVISPDSLPDGTAGTPYNAQLSATGGLGAPYEFSLVSGDTLPPGLTLASDGTISGTPTTPGTFPFTVSVDDPTLKDYTIVIAAPATSSVPPSSSAPGSTTPAPTSSLPSSASPTTTTVPVANTGAPVGQMTALGTVAFLLGALLLLGTVYSGRRRHRRTH